MLLIAAYHSAILQANASGSPDMLILNRAKWFQTEQIFPHLLSYSFAYEWSLQETMHDEPVQRSMPGASAADIQVQLQQLVAGVLGFSVDVTSPLMEAGLDSIGELALSIL